MEPRRSQRALTVASRNSSNLTTNASKKSTTSNKRKISTNDENKENSQTRPTKRGAFGDITNRKVATKKDSKVTVKKAEQVLSSSTDDSIFKSSPSSSTSLSKQSSQNSQPSVNELNTINEEISQTVTRQNHILSLLSVPAPPADHQRTDLEFIDIDEENVNDTFQSPEYAQDIFNYYKTKETEYLVDDYMPRQAEITPAMRAVLVDWLVEVQENFELNHETLYLATRLVDHYLMKRNVTKEALQLIGAAAIFIGCKFDERIPPLVDDFLYICDDAYNRTEFVRMEKDILRTVDFKLGMPLSYRFLRRFAKAGKKSMAVLTLARYINEMALMSYKVIFFKESLVAAGCLRLAMFMAEPVCTWNDTLVHYSGYEEKELKEIVTLLNYILHNKTSTLRTVENKYSHPIFFEVAKRPLVAASTLFTETESSAADIGSTVGQALRV